MDQKIHCHWVNAEKIKNKMEKKTEKPRPTSWKKVPQKVEEREEKDLK